MKNYLKNSFIIWCLFYGVVFWVILEVSDYYTSLVRTTSFAAPQILLFYLNIAWLAPGFLSKGKKTLYFLILFSLIVAHVILFVPVDIYIHKSFPLDLDQFSERPYSFVIFGRFMTSFPPIIISALLWNTLQLRKKDDESLELKNKMLQAETKALKAQINPHFLFNSLNNIYALSQLKSDRTGDAILSLSEMLRFVTYECEKDKIDLTEELKQIRNFIQLQALKDDDQSNVKVELLENGGTHVIAPMLLLPIIENAFKHSNVEDKQKGWIEIKVKLELGHIALDISNSRMKKETIKDELGGVGLDNVRKRLKLIYPNTHELFIKELEDSYAVKLTLKLD